MITSSLSQKLTIGVVVRQFIRVKCVTSFGRIQTLELAGGPLRPRDKWVTLMLCAQLGGPRRAQTSFPSVGSGAQSSGEQVRGAATFAGQILGAFGKVQLRAPVRGQGTRAASGTSLHLSPS